MLVIATPGSATANSYATVAQATALLSDSLSPDLLTPEVQIRLGDALVWATRLIEEQVSWYGAPVVSTQALAWPQVAVSPRGQVWSTTTIPAFLQRATAEYALSLIRETLRYEALVAATTTQGMQGLKLVAIDDVRIEVAPDAYARLETCVGDAPMPPAIRRMLAPYGEVAGGSTVRVLRT
jgi:hypothetical protein